MNQNTSDKHNYISLSNQYTYLLNAWYGDAMTDLDWYGICAIILAYGIRSYYTLSNLLHLFRYLVVSIAFFWVVSHWVVYNILVTKLYPYKNWKKFFVDVALFSLMPVTLNLSLYAYQNFFLFILSIIIWHSLAFGWHLCDSIKSCTKHKHNLSQQSIRIVVYMPYLFYFY